MKENEFLVLHKGNILSTYDNIYDAYDAVINKLSTKKNFSSAMREGYTVETRKEFEKRETIKNFWFKS